MPLCPQLRAEVCKNTLGFMSVSEESKQRDDERKGERGMERLQCQSGISRVHQQIPSPIPYLPHPLCITHLPSLPSPGPHKIVLTAGMPA